MRQVQRERRGSLKVNRSAFALKRTGSLAKGVKIARIEAVVAIAVDRPFGQFRNGLLIVMHIYLFINRGPSCRASYASKTCVIAGVEYFG